MADSKSKSVRPAETYRAPHGLSVSIFRNEGKGDTGEYFKASLQRSYKKGDEFETKRISLGRDDLLAVSKLAEKSWEFIIDAEAASRKAKAGKDDADDE